jgi:putative SOS response-associated peptidase YedK
MCGRYTLTRIDPATLRARFGFEVDPTLDFDERPRFNIAPTDSVLAIRTADGARRELGRLRWGLLPGRWAQEGTRALINARAETLETQPAYRESFLQRRCLIPADGFYEWAEAASGRKAKQPMYVRLRTGEPFAFAGLWDEWTPPAGGEPLRTCTIVTTEANALLATFHHRMPVILAPEVEAVWLDPGLSDPEHLRSLLVPYPAAAMEAYPVSPAVNAARNDDAQLVLPLADVARP